MPAHGAGAGAQRQRQHAEDQRQRDSIRLIASENYASKAVLEATASSLTNKYAEGYPGRRYYEGMDVIDPIERIAIERAGIQGLAMVGLANSHHLARIGRWGEQCAAAGFASVHFVNVLAQPLVAPWGGRDARLATNPFCVTVPHAPHPLVLDYATSMVAHGKTRVAPVQVREAFEFLDKQVENGEWWLRFDQLHFSTGKSLLQWQVDTSTKIEIGQVTQ